MRRVYRGGGVGQDGVVGRTLLPETIACVQTAESMDYVRKRNQCRCSLIGYGKTRGDGGGEGPM